MPFDLTRLYLTYTLYSTKVLVRLDDLLKEPLFSVSSHPVTSKHLFFLLWLCGAAVVLVRLIRRHLDVSRKIGSLPKQPLPDGYSEMQEYMTDSCVTKNLSREETCHYLRCLDKTLRDNIKPPATLPSRVSGCLGIFLSAAGCTAACMTLR